jgi:predicted phage terminase large subunit-like protein
MNRLSHAQRAAVEAAYELFGERRLRNCPLRPSPRQEAFLLILAFELFFGGAAGGGKSLALLMGALQYSDVPGYAALLLRPTLSELHLAGGLIELSHDWLSGSRASWSADTRTWRFPGPGRKVGAGGASVTFGYLASSDDLGRYAGTSYSYLGFDELTRFQEAHYRRMFRVLRQSSGGVAGAAAPDGTRLGDVPVRVRGASNPGGPGHAWVKARFVDQLSRHPDAAFLPSRLADNPYLDQAEYEARLAELPLAERERLLNGDWEIPDDGELFQRAWFELIERHQLPERTQAVRFWDLAGTEPSSANRDPDYTVGLRLDLHAQSGSFYLSDIIRERKAPGAIERLVAETAAGDGRNVTIGIEQEPGAAGKALVERYKRQLLRGYGVFGERMTGGKDVRAQPVAAAAENGLIKLVRGRHSEEFLDELTAFPHGAHDDCIDALSGAHHLLAGRGSGRGTSHVPRGRLPTRAATTRRDPVYGSTSPQELAASLGATYYPSRPG